MYSDFIEEISFEDLIGKCDSGEIDIDSETSKIWAINYIGTKAEEQAEFLMNCLINHEIVNFVELLPENLFKKIYSIKDKDGNIDTISIFKDNVIDEDMLSEVYEETVTEFTIKNFIEEYKASLEVVKEKYDPLNFEGQQKKIDDVKEKYSTGEISLGEMLSEFGYQYDKENVVDIVDKLSKEEMTFEEFKELYSSGKLSNVELIDIAEIINKQFPELNEKFNEACK